MLTDKEIREAISNELMKIDPLEDQCLQPASYDFRVGREAFLSSGTAKINLENTGLAIIEPGEFAVLCTLERVNCGPQIAGQIGLDSTYARQGLNLLSGPQVDPGFDGVLVVRVINLAPRRITLTYGNPFLTVQFFKLAIPVEKPYSGSRQSQTGLQSADIEELSNPDSPTLGGMVKSLATLASDVGELKTSVKWMGWAIPVIVLVGMTVVGLVAVLK